MSPPGTRTTPRPGGVVPTSRRQAADLDTEYMRRLFVRRVLYDVATTILDDLKYEEPLGEITMRADRVLSDAVLEVLRRGLGDERRR